MKSGRHGQVADVSLQVIGRSAPMRKWLGALAVLVLAMRSLVPTGYMLAPVEGHLSVVICAVDAPLGAMTGAHHHHGAHVHSLSDAAVAGFAHASHHAANSTCPYAASSGALLAHAAAMVTAPYFVALQPESPRPDASIPAAVPLRHKAPRGPPTLV
jgi:hypothetical protein